MDNTRIYDFALNIWNKDSDYRAQVEEVRKLVRQRMKLEYKMQGKDLTIAPSARGMALVQMFASFPELQPRVMIPPLVQENKEDERATSIERFLLGIRRATQYGGIHPDDAVWIDGAEAGRAVLYCQFDLDLAKQGLFPFRRKSIDPTTFAFKMSDRGLMCAVTVEVRDTLELYDELAGQYEKVEGNSPEWGVPDVLKRAYDEYQSFPVDVMRYWDREREYMWVGDECVWKYEGKDGRPHLMERCPFDVGFVMQMTGSDQREWGSGIIKYVMPSLKNQSKMLDKAYLGFEFFFMPHIVLKELGNLVRFEQVTPGGEYPNVVETEIVNPVSNAQMLEQLLDHINKEINDASLSETIMSNDVPDVSGFLFSQANAGPQRRNNRLLDSITDAYKSHYNLLLHAIETFANAKQAKEFGITEAEDVKTYLSSFTTHSPMKAKPNARVKANVTLKSEDVKGYQIVEVDFKPEPPEDANAKYQRAQIAQGIGEPMEYIDREILKVESPEQIQQWRKDEALMQDPDWNARMLARWKKDKLDNDKELAKEFQEQDIDSFSPQVAQMIRDQMDQGATFDEAMQWGESVEPPQPQQPAQDPAMMQDPNAMAMQQQGMMQPQQQMMQQPQQGMMDPQAQAEQYLAQLPPELQQVAVQMLQQGMTLEQVDAELQRMMAQQQAQAQQQPSGGFVSSAQMGMQPTTPDPGMGGF